MMRGHPILTLAAVCALVLAVGPIGAAHAASPPRITHLAGAHSGAAGGGINGVCGLAGLVRTAADPRCDLRAGAIRRQISIGGVLSHDPLASDPLSGNPLSVLHPGDWLGNAALSAIVGWVTSSAETALRSTAKVVTRTTSPRLTSSWFSTSYWRVAGIAMLLTLPFLFAAAVHSIVRSDLGLLARAAFGWLPLSAVAVAIASQLTMLLLAATDQMSAIVGQAADHQGAVFLTTTAVKAIAASVATTDPFIAFFVAIVTVAATLALWMELLVRSAAVYVIVLMLPLFFAAMVWPARRTLAVRAIETLIALILSKFAIVAVLSLGAAALGHSSSPSPTAMLAGATLVLLAAISPWAMLRMLPLHELASAAAGGITQGPKQAVATGSNWAMDLSDGAFALGSAASDSFARPGEVRERGGPDAGDDGPAPSGAPGAPAPTGPIESAGPVGSAGSAGAAGSAGTAGSAGAAGSADAAATAGPADAAESAGAAGTARSAEAAESAGAAGTAGSAEAAESAGSAEAGESAEFAVPLAPPGSLEPPESSELLDLAAADDDAGGDSVTTAATSAAAEAGDDHPALDIKFPEQFVISAIPIPPPPDDHDGKLR